MLKYSKETAIIIVNGDVVNDEIIDENGSTSDKVVVKKRKNSWLIKLIGIVGELIFTVGVLIGLFMVWQLMWTDVVAVKEQDQIIAELEQEWEVPETVGTKHTDTPPEIEEVSENEIYATVWIPSFSREKFPLAEGVGLEEVLNTKGSGHYPETAQVGEVGNFSIAGHRNTYGRPLYEIANLKDGDEIIIETEHTYYVYVFDSSEIVKPSNVEVIAPVPGDTTWEKEPTERYLTLTACHPMYSAQERYIVHAKFDYWTPRSEGLPPALDGIAK